MTQESQEAQSLRSRWKAGIFLLLWSLLLFGGMLQLVDQVVDWMAELSSISPVAALAWKALILILFGPLIAAAACETQLFARLRSLWFRGLMLALIAGLVTLPFLLLSEATQLILRLGAIDTNSRTAAGLRLLFLLMSLIVVPVWVTPLLRRLSDTPLGRRMKDHLAQQKDSDLSSTAGIE